jgi:hypothetical protein
MASNCICSSRHSSLQKGVSPLYMKMSLSRAKDLEQSAQASSAGSLGSPSGSASKKKAQARCAAAMAWASRRALLAARDDGTRRGMDNLRAEALSPVLEAGPVYMVWQTGTGTGRRCCGGAAVQEKQRAVWHWRLTVPTGATNREGRSTSGSHSLLRHGVVVAAWLASWDGCGNAASAPRTRLTRLRRDRDEDDWRLWAMSDAAVGGPVGFGFPNTHRPGIAQTSVPVTRKNRVHQGRRSKCTTTCSDLCSKSTRRKYSVKKHTNLHGTNTFSPLLRPQTLA